MNVDTDDNVHLDLGAVVAIGVSLGDKLDKLLEHQRPHYNAKPLQAIPVNSQGWIIFPECRQGRRWSVRRIAVMNGDPWTAGAAGSLAAVAVGQADTGNVKYTEIRQPGTQIPFVATYGYDELPVKPGEMLYIIVHNGSGNEFATADVHETVL